jgi:hypothetical protein
MWTRTYGEYQEADCGYSVQQTLDGGYIIAGTTGSFGAVFRDALLIKTDASGDTLWTKTYARNIPNYHFIHSGYYVEQTSDSGYILCAGYYDTTDYKIWLIKTDVVGDTMWTKTFSGYLNPSELGRPVQQTTDDGYIVAATKYYSYPVSFESAILLIKTDTSGDTLWTKTYGRSQFDECQSVQQTTDDGYIITGFTDNGSGGGMHVFCDLWLIKTDESGDTLWTKTYAGKGIDINVGIFAQQTSDSGYIVTGFTRAYVGDSYLWLIKTDMAGDTLWTKTYWGGGSANSGHSVKQTSDGGYVITGDIGSYLDEIDVWLIKTDESGDTLWTQTFGDSLDDMGYSVQQTSDGGYIVTGVKNGDIWLIKTAPDPSEIIQSDHTIAPMDYHLLQNYPNPFNPITTIEFNMPKTSEVSLNVFNILGEEVVTLVSDRLSAGSYSYEWDASKYASGVYIYRLEAEGFVETKKMILMR